MRIGFPERKPAHMERKHKFFLEFFGGDDAADTLTYTQLQKLLLL